MVHYAATGDRFEHLDFEEAVLRCDYASFGTETAFVDVWGILFHLREHPLPPDVLPPDWKQNDTLAFHAGWSRLTLGGLTGVHIRVYPYAPSFGPAAPFLDSGEGSPCVEYVRGVIPSGVKPDELYSVLKHPYEMYSVLEHPYGHASVVLDAHREVTLQFRASDLVPLQNYSAEPSRYGWWENGRMKSFNG